MPSGVYDRTPEHRAQMSAQRKGKSIKQPKCAPGCTCGKHVKSAECRKKISESHMGKGAGSYIDRYGYRILTGQWGHPLVVGKGTVKEHRKVLYGQIGEGPHPCHWQCGRMLEWRGPRGQIICVDHLDGDKLNNEPENLAVSCFKCNWDRQNPRGTSPESRANSL